MVSSTLAAIAVAVLLTGSDLPDQAPEGEGIPCRAQYAPLTPYELVGMDECGNLWKVILPRDVRSHPDNPADPNVATMGQNDTDEPICMLWDLDTGEYKRIHCPAPGSITGYREPDRGIR